MDIETIITKAAVWLVPLVIAIVFHEVAHGQMARWLGDPTAHRLGRLSFNPLRHIDPVGTVLLPLGLALSGAPVFGWAKPVPVNARQLRNPRSGMMLVALAGPGMNFLLATIALGVITLLSQLFGDGLSRFIVANLANFLIINVMLGVFNLLPLPPFDGGHIVEGLLPRSALPAWAKLSRLGFPIMLLLLVGLPMISPQLDLVGALIVPPVEFILDLADRFLRHFG